MEEAVILEKVITKTGRAFSPEGSPGHKPSSGRNPSPTEGLGDGAFVWHEALVSGLLSKNRNFTVKATQGEGASSADVTACGLPFTLEEAWCQQ